MNPMIRDDSVKVIDGDGQKAASRQERPAERPHRRPLCASCGYLCAFSSLFGVPPCVLREFLSFFKRMKAARLVAK